MWSNRMVLCVDLWQDSLKRGCMMHFDSWIEFHMLWKGKKRIHASTPKAYTYNKRKPNWISSRLKTQCGLETSRPIQGRKKTQASISSMNRLQTFYMLKTKNGIHNKIWTCMAHILRVNYDKRKWEFSIDIIKIVDHHCKPWSKSAKAIMTIRCSTFSMSSWMPPVY